MKKRTIKTAIVSSVLVVAIGGGSFLGYNRYAKAEAAKVAQSFMPTKASIGNISINVSASGTVTSPAQTDVLAFNNGTIESLYFKEGDSVKKGAVLAKIKDTNAEQAVQTAQNNLNKENVNLTNLKKTLDARTVKSPVAGEILNVYAVEGDDVSTVKSVYGSVIEIKVDGLEKPFLLAPQSGTIAKMYAVKGAVINKGDNLFRLNDDDIRSSIDAQNVTLQQAKNDLENKKAALDKTTITSPLDGIIVIQTLKVGDSVNNGKAIATIVDPNQMQTIVPVDELDIQKLEVGMKATVSLDAITGKSFEGEVVKISSIGKVTNNVTTYDVTVDIKNPENVKVGMTANVNIQLQGKSNVVTVPATAVQGRGNNRYVILGSEVRKIALPDSSTSTGNSSNNNRNNANQAANNAVRAALQLVRTKESAADIVRNINNIRQVQVGISDGTNVEILSGLKDSEEVLIPIQSTTNTITQQFNPNQIMQGGFPQGGFQTGGQNRQQRQNQNTGN
jgi:HlyD family secretion protein